MKNLTLYNVYKKLCCLINRLTDLETQVDNLSTTSSGDTFVTWTESLTDDTAVFEGVNGELLTVCTVCPILPQYVDITTTVVDPLDPLDPVFDCSLYNIGDHLFIASDPFCPDFVYLVQSDGNGGCEIKMITKPSNSTSSTGG